MRLGVAVSETDVKVIPAVKTSYSNSNDAKSRIHQLCAVAMNSLGLLAIFTLYFVVRHFITALLRVMPTDFRWPL
jgi:hypothetical protein